MKTLVLLLVFAPLSVYSQSIITLVENTLKLGGKEEQTFYYGFAEGDELILNFEVIKGKHLKEVEIVEFNSTSLFMDYKPKEITDKHVKIQKTGIYVIRFKNTSMFGKVCSFKIQRVPSPGMERFNSTVSWKTVKDTTYQDVQERYLVSKDTSIINIVDQIAKVHSGTNLNGSKNYLNFSLPKNTVAWSYYIGVNQAGQQAYEDATYKLSKLATPVSRLPGFGPLAALALGLSPYIAQLQSGEDVNYYIVEGDYNAKQFYAGQQFNYMKKGLIINTFSQMPAMYGDYFVCLKNDNALFPIKVTVKVTAITVTENWGTRPVRKMNIKSRQVPYLE